MKLKNTIRNSVGVLLFAGLAIAAFAQDGPPQGQGGPQGRGGQQGRGQGGQQMRPRMIVSATMVPIKAMKEELNLSDQQANQIQKIVKEFRSKARPMQGQGGPGQGGPQGGPGGGFGGGEGGPPGGGQDGPGGDMGGPPPQGGGEQGGPPPQGGQGGFGQGGPGGGNDKIRQMDEAASKKIDAVLNEGQRKGLAELKKDYTVLLMAGFRPPQFEALNLTHDQRTQLGQLKVDGPRQQGGQQRPPQGGGPGQQGGNGQFGQGWQGGRGGPGQGGPGGMMNSALREKVMAILTDEQKEIAQQQQGPGGPGQGGPGQGGPGGPPDGGFLI